MKKHAKTRGFTLLELLLVVGIAAILIVAGITTYSLISRSNDANETIRLVNILMDQTRRLYAGQSTYGAAATDLEPALYNIGGIPGKFRSATASTIITPYSTGATAVAIAAGANAGEFTVSLVVPPNSAPEIASAFDPRQSNEIVGLTVCGGTEVTDASAATAGTPATYATACGASTAVPAAANFVIRTR